MPELTWLPSDRWLSLIALVLAAVEFVVGIVTLIRVHNVSRVQKETRQFTQDLLNIDRLEVDLVRVINKFRSSPDIESSLLASELSLQLGMIKGVRRALDESSEDDRRNRNAIQSAVGFFGEQFVKENIQRAKNSIDIITGRTKLVSGFFILDYLRQACERGVQVRVIGLSPNAPDEILQDATKTVSNPPPRDAADYKRQINENMEEILESVKTWRPEVQVNFRYKVNKSVPRVSILRSDNTINFGFLQFYRAAQPVEIAERQYLKIPLSSSTGKIAFKHIDLVWEEAEYIFPMSEKEPPDFSSNIKGSDTNE
jgi:hypothetical protein